MEKNIYFLTDGETSQEEQCVKSRELSKVVDHILNNGSFE